MGRVISDLHIEAGYPYEFLLDFNDTDGEDLENDYSCYFECDSIGQLQFSVIAGAYSLTIAKENTDKLLTNQEEYTVYLVKTSNGEYEKLMSGRIHINNKVRA